MYQKILKVIILLILLNLYYIVLSEKKDDVLRIVYVMTTIPGSCGPFQDYFKQVLLQAKSSQILSEEKKVTEVILLSNFKQCRWALHDLRNGETLELRNISTIESHAIKSLRTLEFEKLLKKIVPKGHETDLTLTSLYRYFMLEDYMTNYTISEVLHMDNDMMIYEDLHHLLPILRTSYPNLGCVPHVHKRFISSSTLWIGNLQSLVNFNNFLLSLGRNTSGEFNQYTSWLREFACCRSVEQGGIFPDEQGRGIKLWGLNDMTMLAYYHYLHKNELKLFPILPKIDFEQKHLLSISTNSSHNKVYINPELDPTPTDTTTSTSTSINKNNNNNNNNNNNIHDQRHRHDINSINQHHHANISLYAVGGYDVGSDLGALFDTSQGGFGDHFHHIKIGATKEANAVATRLIIEQAFLRYNCSISMKCGSSKSYPSNCYIKPFILCGNDEIFTPLLTMHAFRTHPTQYRTVKCNC